MLLPTNFLIGLGLIGAILLATRFARAGRRIVVTALVLLAIADMRIFAARELAALSPGAALSALGSRAKRA